GSGRSPRARSASARIRSLGVRSGMALLVTRAIRGWFVMPPKIIDPPSPMRRYLADMLRLFATFMAAVLLASPAGAQGVERLVPPSPAPSGFIADVAGVVDPARMAEANARITVMQSAGRGDVGVAVLPGIG